MKSKNSVENEVVVNNTIFRSMSNNEEYKLDSTIFTEYDSDGEDNNNPTELNIDLEPGFK